MPLSKREQLQSKSSLKAASVICDNCDVFEYSRQIMPKGSGLTQPKKLSAELADIVGVKEASRAECVKLLWAYLKKHELQV